MKYDVKMFKTICKTIMALAAAVCILFAIFGISNVGAKIGEYEYAGELEFERLTTKEIEGYTDETVCPVDYESQDGYICTVYYTYDDWLRLGERDIKIQASLYLEKDGDHYIAIYGDFTKAEFNKLVRDKYADEANITFTISIAAGLMALGFFVMGFFGERFSVYERSWFLSIMFLSAVFAIIFPEESQSGVNGIWIMTLYLLDTFLNMLCELLISKQSRWNFIVSVFVEIVEIALCIVLAYRFATMAATLFFWLPCDIISFINWSRKKDKDDAELTKVRSLKGWQEVLVIAGIIVFTAVVGYLLTLIDFGNAEIFGGNHTFEVVCCYLDACVTAVGICNGLAILLRFREQWIAWYVSAILETVINILAGQYVLLVLKAGYLTNTTYGFIKWTGYIKKHPEVLEEKSFL